MVVKCLPYCYNKYKGFKEDLNEWTKSFHIKKNLYEDNAKVAEITRHELKKQGTYLINIMSSPGSGKTTLLVATIEPLKDEMKIGVMEADVDSDVDAKIVQDAGAKAIQFTQVGCAI